MNIKTIERIAARNDVRVSTRKEDGKRVIGLHGLLGDVQRVAGLLDGYWVEQATTGYYLYSDRANWSK
jgi:hypothetical protein